MGIRIFGIAGSTNSAEDFRLAACGLFLPTSALNDRAGVLNEPVLTGTGNFTATVSAFTAVIDGTSNAQQGSYWCTVDTATTITIGAANTQARIDLVSLQILDNAYDSSGQQKGQLVVTAGTPAGSPVAPSAPANAVALWTVPVAANATSVVFASATAVFPHAAAAGGIVFVRGASDQPPVVNGVVYRHRGDVGTGGASPLEWSTNGSTWTPVAPAPGMQLIGSATVAVSSTVTSMTINVPAGYSHLMAVWSARQDSGTAPMMNAWFNGVNTNTYTREYLEATGTSAAGNTSSTADSAIPIGHAGDTSTANLMGTGNFTVANSSSTSAFKALTGTAGRTTTTASFNFAGQYFGTWNNSAAITSVSVGSNTATTLTAGTNFSLYGLL